MINKKGNRLDTTNKPTGFRARLSSAFNFKSFIDVSTVKKLNDATPQDSTDSDSSDTSVDSSASGNSSKSFHEKKLTTLQPMVNSRSDIKISHTPSPHPPKLVTIQSGVCSSQDVKSPDTPASQATSKQLINSVKQSKSERHRRFIESQKQLRALNKKIDSKNEDYSRSSQADVEEHRPQWTSNLYFCFVVVTYLIGAGNFVNFPMVVNKYGGIFCLVYIIMYLLFAYSLVLMEFAWGQFCSRGPGACYEYGKIFQGLGYLNMFINLLLIVPYNTKAVWLFYLLTSGDFPWLKSPENQNYLYKFAVKSFYATGETLEDLGTIRVPIVLSSMLIWSAISGLLLGGLAVMENVAVFIVSCCTALFLILISKGLTLPGATASISQLFSSHYLANLIDIRMWIRAGEELIWSMALSSGVHLTYASYNHFNNQVTDDALWTTLVDILASFLGVIFSFAYLGYLADGDEEMVRELFDTSGDKMMFVTMPSAFAKLPSPRPWISVYLIVFAMAIYTTVAYMTEIIITGIMDIFDLRLRNRKYVVLVVCLVSFLCSLLMCTEKGFDVSNMIYYYTGTFVMTAVAFVKILGIAWVYGVDRFFFQTECMVGWETSMILSLPFMKKWWVVCWKYITPSVLCAILINQIVHAITADTHVYATWARYLGLVIDVSMFMIIAVVVIVLLWKAKDRSLHDRLIYLTTPLPSWQPQYPQHRRIVDMGKQLDDIEEKLRQKKPPVFTKYKELSKLREWH